MPYLLKNLRKTPISKSDFAALPQSPGVYQYWANGIPIYIGKAINLKNRLESYLSTRLDPKTASMVSSADHLTYIRVGSELEALLLEANLIFQYQPKYNIIAKDDKHPLYIRITKELYPRILTARKIEASYPNLAFYGPFPSTPTVKTVLKMLRRIFPFADHKPGKRACFYHHLGLCDPCPNVIDSKEEAIRYRKNIFRIKNILNGNFSQVTQDLNKQIKDYSKKLMYEEAAECSRKLKAIEYISQPITEVSKFLENPNLLEDIREKEIEQLQKLLKINKKLNRIECFDVSHLAGVSATASQVTFIAGEADKSAYRSYRIRQADSQNDLASLAEVAQRRLQHLEDWGKPDLLIIDGGLGQVGVFFKLFAPIKVPVVGIAKKRETLILPNKQKIILSPGPAKNLVQRIRNEAHRFAQKYHHHLMKQTLV